MTKLEIRDLTPGYGAEVIGLDPSVELDDEDIALLRKAFDERSLLLFRGLDIDEKYQQHLAKLVIGHEGPTGDGKDVDAADAFLVSNREDDGGAPFGRLLFHSDMMWADTPFHVLTLYGLEVEPPVVPTVFTSSAHAWDTLPEDLRARVEDKHAVHMTGQRNRGGAAEGELLQPIRENVQSTTKPVGYAHPRTGRTLLYVCQMMTDNIVELPPQESEELLEELFAHLYDKALIWQHEWRQGDLVLWDNMAIQHARPDVGSDGPVRTLRKVIAPKPTIRAERPKYSKVS
jgi:alpha-ketoglutarate-dependent taurine dioxygenase